MLSFKQLIAAENVIRIFNGFLWLALLAAPLVNGICVLRRIGAGSAGTGVHPLLFMAVFYSLVSTFHQLPIYLMTSSGLSLAALIWTMAGNGPRWRIAVVAGAGIISVIAVHGHAGERARSLYDHVAGIRSEPPIDSTLPRVRLKVDAVSLQEHAALLTLIDRSAPPDAAILAIPFEPQLYFISGRRNPMRFYNTAIGIRDESTFAATLRILERDPPLLLFDRPDDKYHTAHSRRLLAALLPHYEKIDRIGGLDVYSRSVTFMRSHGP